MPLSAGTRLGPYEILAPIGAGGMGEVYRARDIKLARDVAIKILPDALAQDPDRLARFEREAKVLASLNHTNIAQIYGVEERALVMELVLGETLKGPLPLATALNYARQIAEALEAAHEKGIVHRDLKPANVMVTPEGVVKILDFGLAFVAQEPTLESRNPADSPTITMSPSHSGMIVGTAAYMSPEQARGKPVDRRADIWAFGAVLYEMLTGTPAFLGETTTDLLAAVVQREPDLTQVPARVRRLVEACLRKDAKQRLQAIGDWRLLIEDVPTAGPPPRRVLPWVTAGLLGIALAAVSWAHAFATRPVDRPRPVSRWTVPLAASEPLNGFGVSVSRDGMHLAYAERFGDSSRIVLRNLDQADGKPIAGTDGGLRPFFSPDGQWVAYFTRQGGEAIQKIPVAGGPPTRLCGGASYFGGTWGDDDQIVFATDYGRALMQVSSSGGSCDTLAEVDRTRGEASYRWPQFLPGGKSLLFTIGMAGDYDNAKVALLDLRTGQHRLLVSGGSRGRYAPSGHLVYVRSGTMFAVPFDLKRLAVTGPEAPVVEGVFYNSSGGLADYAFSDSGLLVYMAETRQSRLLTLAWADRKGTTVSVMPNSSSLALAGILSNVSLSPDGQRAAATIAGRAGGNYDIWIVDLVQGRLNRLTSDGINDSPVWTPDGQRVAFLSTGLGQRGIYWAAVDGRKQPELLLADEDGVPDSWTPDGETLLYESITTARIWALKLRSNGGNENPRPLFEPTKFHEGQAQVSPNGRWVAYVSDESGKKQVYVRPFPGPGGKITVSVDGGKTPRWSGNGSELFYLDQANNEIVAVDVPNGPLFSPGQPHALFHYVNPTVVNVLSDPTSWDVAPDGKRFLLRVLPQTTDGAAKMQIVVNWFDELRQRVPSPK